MSISKPIWLVKMSRVSISAQWAQGWTFLFCSKPTWSMKNAENFVKKTSFGLNF